jgi:hypothetical protein
MISALDIQTLDRSGRTYFVHGGHIVIYRSEHPLEERTIELTDDYRDASGVLILPELEAWDGVCSCPGLFLQPIED